MSRIRRTSSALLSALPLAANACSPQSTLWPAGDGADRIARMERFLIALAAIVFVGVTVILVVAIMRHRSDPSKRDVVDLSPRSTRFVIIGGGIIPSLILLVIFIAGTALMGAFPAPPAAGRQLTIHITGHQWWWQADYDYRDLQQRFTTANELHIPVGVPVTVDLTSRDVIHSFWVPRLQGKLDVIPGDTNHLRLLANSAGVYRGACAEFCGAQHAHMGIIVVAEPLDQFRHWATEQLAPATAPADSLRREGQRLFVTAPCALCHTVRGTPAGGTVGPDLTHVGSRQMIGAALLPNTLASLEGWIANSQALKPANQMPPMTQFTGGELRALAAYVYGLK